MTHAFGSLESLGNSALILVNLKKNHKHLTSIDSSKSHHFDPVYQDVLFQISIIFSGEYYSHHEL